MTDQQQQNYEDTILDLKSTAEGLGINIIYSPTNNDILVNKDNPNIVLFQNYDYHTIITEFNNKIDKKNSQDLDGERLTWYQSNLQ